jgi:hypothetical protein
MVVAEIGLSPVTRPLGHGGVTKTKSPAAQLTSTEAAHRGEGLRVREAANRLPVWIYPAPIGVVVRPARDPHQVTRAERRQPSHRLSPQAQLSNVVSLAHEAPLPWVQSRKWTTALFAETHDNTGGTVVGAYTIRARKLA